MLHARMDPTFEKMLAYQILAFAAPTVARSVRRWIYTVFLGDMVKNQTVDKEYNHYSVLRTIEDNFSLPQLNSGDANAAPITEAWK